MYFQFVQYDASMWNRISVLPFESKFVSQNSPTHEQEQFAKKIFPQKQIDFKKLKYALMWKLVNFCKIQQRSLAYGYEYPEPVLMQKAKLEYWKVLENKLGNLLLK